MVRTLMAALVAFALAAAVPAFACDGDCAKKGADCAKKKDTVAEAEKKGEKDPKMACHCTSGKDCKCKEGKCACPNCQKEKKTEETKKT